MSQREEKAQKALPMSGLDRLTAAACITVQELMVDKGLNYNPRAF